MSDSRINIAHVCWQLELGGLERLLVDFARHADRERFSLRCISLNGRGRIADELEALGVEVTSFPETRRPGAIMIGRLVELLARWDIRIVHTHNSAPLMYAAPAAALVGAMVVHTRHGRGMSATRRQRTLARAASHLVERFVCVSAESAAIASYQRFCPQRINVIRNGVNLEIFPYRGLKSDGPIVAVARLSPQKDLGSLIRAMALAVRENSTLRLEIAGEGESRLELENLISEFDLHEHVGLLGAVDDIPGLLQSASQFVLSSRHEGLSLSILEAMATGLPVVATRVGGNAEVVVDGRTGFLVEPGDPQAIANALLTIHHDPTRARRMGAAGRRRVEGQFDVHRMIQQYETLYSEVVRPHEIAAMGLQHAC
jgi:glycosyltransferase involved in cell wall biosynthesis